MDECPVCGGPTKGCQFECHHHNTDEYTDDVGNLVVKCQDCPEWWVVKPEVPC